LVFFGVALGCDYPTAHLIRSESTPSTDRGRLALGAFGFQALGALIGTAVGGRSGSRPPASTWKRSATRHAICVTAP